MPKIERNQYYETIYKLRRTESQLLAAYARTELMMILPNGWTAFYRLTPREINTKFPSLSVATILREARVEIKETE